MAQSAPLAVCMHVWFGRAPCSFVARALMISASSQMSSVVSLGAACSHGLGRTYAERHVIRFIRDHCCRAASSKSAAEQVAGLPEVIETKGVPVMLYAKQSEVEPEAVQQLIKLAESPLPVGHVSAMPDVHLGKGVTIGTVFASEQYVCPNAVGVDIGCVPVDGLFKGDLSRKQMLAIQERIKQWIPTGPESHKRAMPRARETLDEISHARPPSRYLEEMADNKKVALQLGTLGGGNHFLEACILVHIRAHRVQLGSLGDGNNLLEVLYDEKTEQVFLMLHSGSRNIGNTTAQHYDKAAARDMKQRGIRGPSGLNYLEIASQDGQAYLQDMDWCQEYAFHNRRVMMDLLASAVEHVTGKTPFLNRAVNIHHNYCQCEQCSWKDVRTGEQKEGRLWVTRKGATSARKGQKGIIPGSMGVGSFVTVGNGDPMSWNSCSHGAGRAMSRTKAKATILQADFERAMAGVVCDTAPGVKDEAPSAYKDITKVMAAQADLVDIDTRLLPLINVKGF